MEEMGTLPASDTVLNKLKSDGTFDQFRKSCLSALESEPSFTAQGEHVANLSRRYLQNFNWRDSVTKNDARSRLKNYILGVMAGRSGQNVGIPLESLVRKVLEAKSKELLPKIMEIIDSLAVKDSPAVSSSSATNADVNHMPASSLAVSDKGSLPLPIDIPGMSVPKKRVTETSSHRPKPKAVGDGKRVPLPAGDSKKAPPPTPSLSGDGKKAPPLASSIQGDGKKAPPPLLGDGKKAPPSTVKPLTMGDRASKGEVAKSKDRPKGDPPLMDDRDRHAKALMKDKMADSTGGESKDKIGSGRPSHLNSGLEDIRHDVQSSEKDGSKMAELAEEEGSEDCMKVHIGAAETSHKKNTKNDVVDSSAKEPCDVSDRLNKESTLKEQKERRDHTEHHKSKKEQREKKDQKDPIDHKEKKDQKDHAERTKDKKDQKDHSDMREPKKKKEQELKEFKEKEPKEKKEQKEQKDHTEMKGSKELKEQKDHTELKEPKERKDKREQVDSNESKERKEQEFKERKEKKEKKVHREHAGMKEPKGKKELELIAERKEKKEHLDHAVPEGSRERKDVKDHNVSKDQKGRKEQSKLHKDDREQEEEEEEDEQKESGVHAKEGKKEHKEQKEKGGQKDCKKQVEQKTQIGYSESKAPNLQRGINECINQKEVVAHKELKEHNEPREPVAGAGNHEATTEEIIPPVDQVEEDTKDKELMPRRRSSRLLSLSETSEGKASIDGEPRDIQENSSVGTKKGGQKSKGKRCLQSSSPDSAIAEGNDGYGSDTRGQEEGGDGGAEHKGDRHGRDVTRQTKKRRTVSQDLEDHAKKHKAARQVSEKPKSSVVVVTRYNRQVKRNRRYSPSSELGADESPTVTDSELQMEEVEDKPPKRSRSGAKR